MLFDIREVGVSSLPIYGTIPISFVVESEFRIKPIGKGLGGLQFCYEEVTPYVKYEEDCSDGISGPANWLKRHDATGWGFFIAFAGERPVGGAAVAVDVTAGIATPFEREDVAALWDLRVHLDYRRRGVGSRLLEHAANWARQRGYRQLKIETQNVNVPACRFYAKQGCELGAIHRYGYAGCPDVTHEAMLIWYLNL